MLHIICALKCEANPLIRYFELEKSNHDKLFCYYTNPGAGLSLTLSGVGKINAAAAVLYTQTCLDGQPYDSWLNLGISGHATDPVGSIYLAHKVTDAGTGKSWYPQLVFTTPCETRNLVTLDKPSTRYTGDIIDMEASGFCELAGRLSTFEQVHCCKVISDNRKKPVQHPPAEQVEELVSSQLDNIESIIRKLFTLESERMLQFPVCPGLRECIQQWHFSASQQHTLKRLLGHWQVIFPDEDIFNTVGMATSSREVIKLLEQAIQIAPLPVKDL